MLVCWRQSNRTGPSIGCLKQERWEKSPCEQSIHGRQFPGRAGHMQIAWAARHSQRGRGTVNTTGTAMCYCKQLLLLVVRATPGIGGNAQAFPAHSCLCPEWLWQWVGGTTCTAHCSACSTFQTPPLWLNYWLDMHMLPFGSSCPWWYIPRRHSICSRSQTPRARFCFLNI